MAPNGDGRSSRRVVFCGRIIIISRNAAEEAGAGPPERVALEGMLLLRN